MVNYQSLDQKVVSLSRGRSSRRISSPELTFCADSYSVSIPSLVTTVAHNTKRPWSFCQKCRWKVTPKHAYTFHPTKLEWADYNVHVCIVQEPIREKKLTCNPSGHTWPQSYQLAELLWTDPGLKKVELVSSSSSIP